VPDPFAIIIGGGEVRVPIEQMFDVQPGELIVQRVMGNIAGRFGGTLVNSIEFGIARYDPKLLIVLGDSQVTPHPHPHPNPKLVSPATRRYAHGPYWTAHSPHTGRTRPSPDRDLDHNLTCCSSSATLGDSQSRIVKTALEQASGATVPSPALQYVVDRVMVSAIRAKEQVT
jgi:hypothetical protein